MKFRFEIIPAKSAFGIDYSDHLMFVGSCFAENIGDRFVMSRFNTQINPYGVMFNPVSVANMLYDLAQPNCPDYSEIIGEHKGLWYSLAHHGSFSSPSKEVLYENMIAAHQRGHFWLNQCSVLFVTFGTAWVYRENKSGKIVANCHKLPEDRFTRYRLTVEAIVSVWLNLLQKIRTKNTNLKVVFTVSPVRHLKDGAHENQLSKSVLLLAVESLCRQLPYAHYFEAYELIMDDLRDYRFYDTDLAHPNDLAVAYIWEKVQSTYMSDKTMQCLNEVSKLVQALNHRPLHGESDEFKAYRANTIKRIRDFELQHPGVIFNDIEE